MFPRSISKSVRLACCVGFIVVATVALVEASEDDRTHWTAIEIPTTLREPSGGVAETRCFEVYNRSAGHLWIDVSVPGSARVEPRIYPFSQSQDADFTYIERFATGMWLEIRVPGSFAFCVAAQDPLLSLGEYKLTTAFVDGVAAKGGDPDEDEPDPEAADPPVM